MLLFLGHLCKTTLFRHGLSLGGVVLQVISVVARPGGARAASIGSDGCLRLWDASTGQCLSNKVGAVDTLVNTHTAPHQLGV